MRDWYWRVVAAVGLVVAAVYVFGVCRPFSPTPVGAQAGEIVAVTPSNQQSFALYVIDTSKKVLLVYDSGGRGMLAGFTLVYGRHIEPDAVVASQVSFGELQFQSRGYSGRDINNSLRKMRP